MAVQLLLCGVLPPGLVQYCSQHSCVVAVKLFLHSRVLMSVSVDDTLLPRYYLPTPPLGQDMTQGQFLSGV